ncbi:MAG: acyl-CoA desaturase [Actinomycetota bacterium]
MDRAHTVAVERPVPGVVSLGPSEARLQRVAILILTIGPFVGFLAAIAILWGRGVSGVDLIVFLAFYMVTGLGVTVGYHRLLTHRSFRASRSVRAFFAVAGSLAIEGSVISWVAAHRRHHAFADVEGDPHSPHLAEEEGLVGVLKGLWHAHVGWLFDEEKTSVERWAPDLLKDPVMRRIDRLFPHLAVITLVLPAVVGFAFTGTLWGAITAFLWAGLARVFLLHHMTWSVNSICHYFGKRPFETTDLSTNNWPLALLSFGESWHNNHHAFPTAAIHGLGRWQLDTSGLVIRALERLGLARDVKRVTQEQVISKTG